MTAPLALVLAQDTAQKTSSTAAVVFGMFALVGILSIFALTKRGRRTLMPVVALLLGVAIGITTVTEAHANRISPITFLGLFVAGLLIFGGLGALREGILVPKVEGHDPPIDPVGPPATGTDPASSRDGP
jgi:sugar phosphate permease